DRRRGGAPGQAARLPAAWRRGRTRGRVGTGRPGRRRGPRDAAARARILRARAPVDGRRPAARGCTARSRGRRPALAAPVVWVVAAAPPRAAACPRRTLPVRRAADGILG